MGSNVPNSKIKPHGHQQQNQPNRETKRDYKQTIDKPKERQANQDQPTNL
jgi:hypothetical protein